MYEMFSKAVEGISNVMYSYLLIILLLLWACILPSAPNLFSSGCWGSLCGW